MSDYTKLTKDKLKEKCRERSLDVSGNKSALLDRLEEDDKKKAQTLQPVQSNKEKGKEISTVQNKSSVQLHSRPAPRTSNQPTSSSSSSAAPQNAPAARVPAQRAKVLYLPSISTLAQERFTFQDHQGVESLLFVEMPEKIVALEKAINDAWIRRPTKKTGAGVYLHGIQGIGKSHLLYYEVWKLRQQNYRVCYISDLGKISKQPDNSFFQVLSFSSFLLFIFFLRPLFFFSSFLLFFSIHSFPVQCFFLLFPSFNKNKNRHCMRLSQKTPQKQMVSVA